MTGSPLWSTEVAQHGNTSTVTIKGEVDRVAADQLRLLLVAQLDRPDTTGVVADLAAVTFLDSAALSTLIVAYRHAEEHRRRFVIVHPNPSVRRVLEIGGVYDILVG